MDGKLKRKHPLAECENCPLYKGDCAPTTGPKDAKVAVVSRSPGYYEAIGGKPFSGPSGKVLDYLLGMNGVKREEILVTNTVLCHSEGKVPLAAIKACSPRLQSEIELCDTVIAAGSEAVKEILGRTGIDSLRGYEHHRNGTRIVVTNNPALVLHDDSTFPNLRKDFALAFNPRPPVVLPEVEEIYDPGEGIESLHDILGSGRVQLAAGDIENRGGLTHRGTLVSFNLAVSEERAFVYTEEVCNDGSFIDVLRTFLQKENITWIWHNGKYDIKLLRHKYGINARVDEDTLLLGGALDERPGVHSLEYMLMDEFGWPNYSSPEIEAFKKSGYDKDGQPLPVPTNFYRYAGLDAAGTYRLFNDLRERAHEDNVFEIYKTRMIEDAETLARMELEGVIYDVEAAADIHEFELMPEVDKLKRELRRLADNELLNPSSPIQMAALYYDELKVNHAGQTRPDKARSVDKTAREGILEGKFTTDLDRRKIEKPPQGVIDGKRKLVLNITEGYDRYQSITKQDSTYIRGLIKLAEKDTNGRVYTEFNIMGTESGRLSSKGPNLQNITRPKEGLPNIRRLFKASPGRVIIQADYSQAELRTIAYLSGDPELKAIYYDTSRSLHKEMAAQFYGENYTYEQYVQSKNINFGVCYWQGAFSFSTMYHMPQDEAQAFIDAWWKRFPRVYAFTHEIAEDVVKKGVIVNPFGRKRRFYLITKENKEHAQKEGINFCAQSTAWDFTGSAMNLIRDEIDWSRGPLIITVHDSLVGDVDEDYVDEWTSIVKEIMETTPKNVQGWDIPFKSDISIGPNWGEVEEI